MERESFENEAIAKTLNEHFVSIKVDREERCGSRIPVKMVATVILHCFSRMLTYEPYTCRTDVDRVYVRNFPTLLLVRLCSNQPHGHCIPRGEE